MNHLYSVIALATLMATAAARADITVYDNEADFLAAAPPVVTQTFDDLPDMQVPLTIEVDGLEYSTVGTWQLPGGCSVDRSLGASSIARRYIAIKTPSGGIGAVRALAFRLTTFAIAPPADYFVGVATFDGEHILYPIGNVVNSEPAYRGFVSTSPIVGIIVNAHGLTQFNFCLDDVSHSQILDGDQP